MLTQTPTGKQHTVCFVTNTARANLLTENNVPTLERYRALLHSYTNEAGVVAGGVLLMTGQYTGALTDKGTIAQPIPLTRGVAKITFTYRTANFDDGTIRILAVQLKNVAHRTAYLVSTAAPYPAIGSHADYAPETAPDEATGSYTWYLPENVRGINPAITWEGNKSKKNAPTGQGDCATLVEVRAEVTTRDGATSNIAYQFFIGQDITDYSVKRNRHYRLNIDFRGIDESDQRVVTGNSTPWLAATVGISDVSGTGATVRATITSDGGSPITARGFYVTEDKNEIGTTRAYLGAGMYVVEEMPSPFTRAAFVPEVIEQTLTGLKRTTTYYVRPYATNRDGTTVGEQATFSTTGAPTIVTVQVSDVKATTAKVTYQITDNGASSITEKGVVYSTQKDFAPTASGVVKVPSTSLTELTLGAGGAGSNNPPLREKTTYYVRAYASNREGSSYGKQLLLTTKKSITFAPVWMTVAQDMYVQASVGATDPTVPTGMGVMWSTTDFANPASGIQVSGTKNGDRYTLRLGDGYPATWYLYPYGQAYGDNSYGTKYSAGMVPTASAPAIPNLDENAKMNKVTFEVATQGSGTGSSIASRGIVYSTTSSFDPQQTGTKVPGTTTNSADLITAENVLPNQYYARAYIENSAGHTYYSALSPFLIEPKLEVSSTWGKGEDISAEASTFTLEFETNTDWTITATNATLSESSGASTKWATKSVTVTVNENEGRTKKGIAVQINTITNGVSVPITRELTMKQPPVGIKINNTIWASGNLYYDTVTGEYKNATTQEYVHNEGVPEGGSYFGWNTLSWIGQYNQGDYTAANDPCTKVKPFNSWVTPSKEQAEELIVVGKGYYTGRGYQFYGSENLYFTGAGYRVRDGSMVGPDHRNPGNYRTRSKDCTIFFAYYYSGATLDLRDLPYYGCTIRCVRARP